MQLVVGEMTYPVMAMVKWQRIAFGMTATPLSARDVVNAHLGFLMARLVLVDAVFLAVLAPFGVYDSVAGVRRGVPRPAAARAGLRHADLRAQRRAQGRERRSRWSSGSG